MRLAIVALVASAVLSACSTTPDDLEKKTDAVRTSIAENYQEIYRRVSGTARRCVAGNISAYASMAVDTDLFPDLGFGEVKISLINAGVRNYYVSTKIERAGRGTSLIIRSGNTLAAQKNVETMLRWANGDNNC